MSAAVLSELAVTIPPLNLAGDLTVCQNATGVVLFAHGSGSSRHSARNRLSSQRETISSAQEVDANERAVA
jgi:hypothetical protein